MGVCAKLVLVKYRYERLGQIPRYSEGRVCFFADIERSTLSAVQMIENGIG